MEGRNQERKQIIYFLRVFDAQNGALLGHVVDLTTRGFMMTSERQLTKGKTMLLRVELPQRMKGPQHLELKGRVKWSKPDANSSFFKTGLGIMKLSKADEKILTDLIQNFLYQEPPEEDESTEAGR